MLLSLIFPLVVLGEKFDGYGPTAFDISLSPEIPLEELTGYGTKHAKERKNKGFGDLSLVDFNMETEDSFDRNKLVEIAWNVLDSSHGTIMTMQSIRKGEIDALSIRALGHYEVLNSSEGSYNVQEAPITYLPIVFDTLVLDHKKSGYVRNPENNKIIYASWAIFEHKRTKRWFTVVNVDMYSAYSEKTDVQMANILEDMNREHTVDSNPVFFMGHINAISDRLQKVIEDKYINPLDVDRNAKEGPKFTMKNLPDILGNFQRDFVLVRDASSKVVRVNYARILRKGLPTLHYPIHAIVSFEAGDQHRTPSAA
ncbi:uncharacterized protein Eint_070870 [Encephalitozoon intestinalis ATCC 50506]|uniref:Endonuclease/exonuclease/phosphatase domain-containing protein n=1 Tax=Encephalitozoon intestinalis (strain ATCC 50506) TaxID=876142 RepID=E0S815_ENCIT|nr:uncharacterized protein Eint_070870 [Encephalitozoon intestinalis ATCC 50506]ADM11850.1 hypothetical protein Eint_070870 [Encephalitozoon intestinalis ATCC 50506]UTX45602.1 DNA phosphodiesterase [Encephalitozoon intestinalis]